MHLHIAKFYWRSTVTFVRIIGKQRLLTLVHSTQSVLFTAHLSLQKIHVVPSVWTESCLRFKLPLKDFTFGQEVRIVVTLIHIESQSFTNYRWHRVVTPVCSAGATAVLVWADVLQLITCLLRKPEPCSPLVIDTSITDITSYSAVVISPRLCQIRGVWRRALGWKWREVAICARGRSRGVVCWDVRRVVPRPPACAVVCCVVAGPAGRSGVGVDWLVPSMTGMRCTQFPISTQLCGFA